MREATRRELKLPESVSRVEFTEYYRKSADFINKFSFNLSSKCNDLLSKISIPLYGQTLIDLGLEDDRRINLRHLLHRKNRRANTHHYRDPENT